MSGAIPVSTPPICTLDPWIAARIRGNGAASVPLTRRELLGHQMRELRATLARVLEFSKFYGEHLAGVDPGAVRAPADLAALPLTRESDLRQRSQDMLCVGQDEVARIMTLMSSGTTGPAKRLHFSAQDLERTVDFFHHGMQGLIEPGQTVLILLPGPSPDSTGDLLARALARMQVRAAVHGLVTDAEAALAAFEAARPHCVVGLPVHLLLLAGLARARSMDARLQSILLCSDYIPASISERLAAMTGAKVFSHYGTVETGLGGGVECAALCGCHLREADMFLEIVDPDTGGVLWPGQWGEIVVTTLGREAMPLVRYATGDLGRIMGGQCPCGSILQRLDKVRGRRACMPDMANGARLDLARLDEALFGLDGLLDYQATLDRSRPEEVLRLEILALPGLEQGLCKVVRQRLAALPELQDAAGGPGPGVEVAAATSGLRPLQIAKRVIGIKEKQ